MPKHSRSPSPSPAPDAWPTTTTAHTTKYSRLSVSPPSPPPPPVGNMPPGKAMMRCLLPPHGPLAFDSAAAFTTHYLERHVNRCVACGRNFPSAHVLGLHQSERHDPLAAGRREAGERTYACLVPGCGKVTLTAGRRRMHCVDKHGFPRGYDFGVVWRGIEAAAAAAVRGGGRGRGRVGGRNGGKVEQRSEKAAAVDVPIDGDDGPSASASASVDAPRHVEDVEDVEDERVDGGAPAADPAPATGPADVDRLADGLAALRFVPPSVVRRSRAKAKER